MHFPTAAPRVNVQAPNVHTGAPTVSPQYPFVQSPPPQLLRQPQGGMGCVGCNAQSIQGANFGADATAIVATSTPFYQQPWFKWSLVIGGLSLFGFGIFLIARR